MVVSLGGWHVPNSLGIHSTSSLVLRIHGEHCIEERLPCVSDIFPLQVGKARRRLLRIRDLLELNSNQLLCSVVPEMFGVRGRKEGTSRHAVKYPSVWSFFDGS